MTRTTEQLRERIRGLEITLQHKNWEASKADLECLKELLAVREAQPVAWITKPTFEDNDGTAIVFMTSANLTGCIPLFTAPPAPAVPAAIEPTLEAIKAILPTANPDEYACCVGADMWNACRAAMLENTPEAAVGIAAAINIGNMQNTPAGFKLVPSELTAENGAKASLIGEFTEIKYINCTECFGDDECESCDGSGRIKVEVPVTWTTIKAIWKKGIEHFDSLAAAPTPTKPDDFGINGDALTPPGVVPVKWIGVDMAKEMYPTPKGGE